jgi:ribonuclease Z
MGIVVNSMLQGMSAGGTDFKTLAHTVDTECDSEKEPVVLFLGTVSMKPTQYRSASAILLFIKGHGLLMDCAEGSYGQLLDHFQSTEKVNEVLLKMRGVFITHIHGDHQLGVIKIMLERDRLIDAQGTSRDPNNKLYVVAPNIMLDYLETMRTTVLR